MLSANRIHVVFAVVAMVTLASGAAGDDRVQFIRASAHNPGVANTLWVTDARVFNPDAAESISVWLAFLPAGADNSNVTEVEVVIEPREAAALDDVVASLFGEASAGAIRLRSELDFLATSRTYNIGDGSSGTYGQYIPAVAVDTALERGILLQVANDPDPSGFRTNVGFVNPSLEPCSVTFEVFDLATATRLGGGTVTLEPLGFRQVNDVFRFIGAADVVVRNASVELAAEPAVLAYASVVDNTSGDPIFVSPFADTGTPATTNNPPQGTIDSPADDVTVDAGTSIAFAGSASDPDGDQVTVLWDFGDGMTSTELEPGDHTYPEPGVFTVTFTATDERGLADPTPDSRVITVVGDNQPPEGTITQPADNPTITLGDPVTFAGDASDPDGDQVTVLWDFGDGSTSTELMPGNYTYASAGTFTVTLTATDEHGLADPTPDSRTITVQAPNSAPDGVITEPAGNVTVTAGESVSFAGSVSDPDGNQVTVLWDFGDGISSTELNPGPHTYAAAGVFTVTFTATDEHGLPDPTPDSRTITVNPAGVTLTQVQTSIFTPQCVGCHGGSEPTAGMNLEAGQAHSNLVNVPATTQSGTRVVPFDPDSSVLVLFLEDGHRDLPPADIQAIRDWITGGALDN